MNTDAFVSHDNLTSFRDDKENHYHLKNWKYRKLPSRTQGRRWGSNRQGKQAGLGKSGTGVHLCSRHPDGSFQVGL